MTRHRRARLLTGLSALGFLGTAWLHSTGYDSVVRVASDVPGMMGQIMPGLWLIFSFDLTTLGLILGVLALRPAEVARPILVIAALCPLAAAGLQVRFIGFVPPTALLLSVGVLTLLSAVAWPPLYADKAAVGTNGYSIITRDDGSTQWALNGQALYFYQGDSAPGDTNGEGVNGLWNIAVPPAQ